MLDVPALRQLLALARHESLTAAARALGITQSALTKSVQRVERRLGVTVLDRGRRPARLTAAGLRLVERVRVVLENLDELPRDAERLRAGVSGRVTAAVGPLVAELLLVPALLCLMRDQPHVTVTVRIGSWREMTPLLKDGRVECFVGDVTEATADPTLVTRPFATGRVVAFCRRGHPLLAPRAVGAADLLAFPLVAPTAPAWGSRWVQALFRRAGRPIPRPEDLFHVVCDSHAALGEVVAATDCVGFAPPAVLAALPAAGRLATLPFDTSELRTRPGAVVRGASPLSAPAEAFLLAVEGAARERMGQDAPPAATAGRVR